MESPTDERALLSRARALGGRTLAEVAGDVGLALPDLSRAKGFVGQLVEKALGAPRSAGVSGPDFPALGLELKTVPIGGDQKVRESTFVCGAPLAAADRLEWGSSRVRAKLARVLFVLVEADRSRPPHTRRIGAAFLWSPDEAQTTQLRADWEALMGRIGSGDVEALSARSGVVLQLRPKGANRKACTRGYDADGAPFLAPRRAFYLRRSFTQALVDAEGLA